MNKLMLRIIAILVSILFIVFFVSTKIKADESYDAIYFGSHGCLVCQSLENTGVLVQLADEGYNIKKYMSEDDYELFEEMFSRYARTYQVPKDQNLIPLLYVGETYFIGKEAIQQAIESGMAQKIMDEETLLDPLELIYADVTFNDLIILSGSTLLLGLLDAFNPCALAMLLMFLSFLTDKKRSKTILYICFSYILAVFVTYFILGRFLATALSALLPYMKVFYSIIILLALFISILNFLDFMSARKQKYGEIKNQLPNKFFVLTRKIMSNFSEKIESGNKMIYITAFLIGAFVAIVEFPCSGQAFVAWTAIVVDRTTHFLLFNILLFIYVLFFVAPLIIITFIGLRAKSINTVSNFIRTRLDIIKLMNSIIFLGVAIYYIYKVFIGGI